MRTHFTRFLAPLALLLVAGCQDPGGDVGKQANACIATGSHCADLGLTGAFLEIDPAVSGVYDLGGGLSADVIVYGECMDFESNASVLAVIVDDGTIAQTYVFDPASGSERWLCTFWDGLRDPMQLPVTRLELCYVGAPPPSPPPPEGCTYTFGYWKTHSASGPAFYDDTWDLVGPLEEQELFAISGMTYYDVLWTEPAGNTYFVLAHQYIGALLNGLAGVDLGVVEETMALAEEFFADHTTLTHIGRGLRANMIVWADILADFNEGTIGPGHCD